MLTITDVMKLLLCGQKRATIQPDEVYDMFEAELSEVGSNQRDLEEEAMMHFMLFLSSLTNLSTIFIIVHFHFSYLLVLICIDLSLS